MIIRPEQNYDQLTIAHVTARAFADFEHSDQSQPEITERLRGAGALSLSLVAIKETVLIGHVAYFPVTIDEASAGLFGLGPVSVVPEHPSSRIGSALICAGLEQLRSEGAAGCVVLGDPGYSGSRRGCAR